MPTLNSDHNLFPAARHRPNSPSVGYDAFLHPTIDHLESPPSLNVKHALPHSPAYSFNHHPFAQAPRPAPSFDHHSFSAGIDPFSADPFPEDDCLDPHDFYRRYQDTDGQGPMGGLGQSDLVVVTPGNNMITSRQSPRPNPASVRINGTKHALLSSRVPDGYGSRNQASSTEHSPIAPGKPGSMAPGASRNRQTSLKDLVDRFNQMPNEVPPLPRKSASRSTPTNSHNPSNTHHARASALSPSKSAGAATTGKGDDGGQGYPEKVTRLHHRRGRRSEDKEITPRSSKSPISPRTMHPDPNTFASQSMIDLTPSDPPFHRKPLFGEILPVGVHHGDVGYGIPGPRRRRGSEGSMHSPNPMFPDEMQTRRVSPSSPSAWYLGVTPTLEEIKMEKMIPNLPPKLHRRTRSDFAGLLPRPPPPSTPMPIPDSSSYPAPSSPPPSSNPPMVPAASTASLPHRHDSQSRIPISSRRLSMTSDSGNSNPSTRTNSALERHSTPLTATKSAGAISKPAAKARSPVRTARPTSSRNSPRRGDYGPRQQFATSPRLTAKITAPLPKKSPPLRSSRPRPPVSSASTSASRAKAVERLVDRESGDSKNFRELRSKRPPELGAVDFAARRQKIQQAFTKTVKENERQAIEAERRRIVMAQHRQGPSHETNESFEQESLTIPPPDEASSSQTLHSEIPRNIEEQQFQAPSEDLTRAERELVVDTGDITSRPTLDLNQEDSPTLGGFHRYTDSKDADREPSSALTESTSNSVDTYFDQEPQEDSPDSFPEHRTSISQQMSVGDGSPISAEFQEPVVATEESASEKDDQESIHIMLRETPVIEKASYKGPLEEQTTEGDSEAAPGDRWSMSSWASSSRSDDPKSSDQERLAPMERIDEHSPMKPNDSGHLSVSTASTCQTPQPWSPATFSSPMTNRTTMESDTYSTINRVLDHYHDQNLLSPDLNNHLMTQSPDLARQGAWDPKKVTQLYLQELARARNQHASGASNSTNNQHKMPVLSAGVIHEESDGKQVVEQQAEKEAVLPRASLDVVQNESNPHRASLNAPTDWDMSPSITDWIHLQAEAESPLDEKPAPVPKDRRAVDERGSEKGGLNNPILNLPPDYPPELPEIEGAGEGLGIGGLAISVTEPQDDDSPVIPPPPLPDHLPPPPPIETTPEDTPSSVNNMSPPSPSVYSSHLSNTSSYPSGFSSAQTITAGSEETFRATAATTSTLPSVRSSISREATSTVASSEATGKPPTPSADQKRLIRRRHIIKELVDTEHSFGQDMKVVDDIYKGTSNVIIISAEDVKTLFSNSDQIVTFSTHFLDALKAAAKGVYVLPKSKRWRNNRTSDATSYSCNTDDQASISGGELTDEEKDRLTSIGDAFEHHMTSMEKVYGDYLKNHDAANQKLQQLQKNTKVQIWLKECRAYAHDLTSAWDLDSLLVKPVQRILKYPLLLDQLLEVTPENHPDFVKLDGAAREMKGISMRINEMKKRADLMEQVANNNNRKRKESDVRNGLSKAFGRRTEKLRQQVGLSDLVEDKAYAAVSERFGSHFFQLQVVMRDVEMYTNDVQHFMNRFTDFILAIEAHIDVGQTNFPAVESKWRKFRMSTREMSMTALTDHIAAVRKNVIDPMTTLLKLHDGPQKLMQKRSKRLMDYARYKSAKDRGEKLDKKLTDQGEQFLAINETLKEELPKLFALTGKLVEACLNNFVQLQRQWNVIWRRKLSQAIDDCKVPGQISDIVDSFAGDFAYFEAQVLALGICNGSMLADAVNQVSLLSPSTNAGGEGTASPVGASSSLDVTKRRTLSISSDRSPMLPQPDFGARNFSVENGLQLASGGLASFNHDPSNRRMRASSTVSSQGPRTPEMPGGYRSYFHGSVSNSIRPITSISRTTTEPSPSLPRSSLDVPVVNRLSGEGLMLNRPRSGSTYPPPGGLNGRSVESTSSQTSQDTHQRSSSPSSRFSGLFSSAMPMSDSPPEPVPVGPPIHTEFKVLFLAASVYEFNIDRARKEAGYPYLTYVAGEIFDVIGEKGELWLSKNQDDATNQVGWIWNKHFVKLAS